MNKALRILHHLFKQQKDLRSDSRSFNYAANISYSYLQANDLSKVVLKKDQAGYLIDKYLNHHFDLLGSGWVKNSYDSKALGLEGCVYDMNLCINTFDGKGKWLKKVLLPAYLDNSRAVWSLIKDSNYQPLDWQKDFKSGYRWSAKKWYKDQKYGRKKGADIKVPWELARLQHLPQMAVFAVILPDRRKELLTEFKNQILDFIAANPPRMGVNWTCTMDVAIRAANILVACDLFIQIDEDRVLSEEIMQVISNAVYEHGLHIINNMEWSDKLTANHYLSNVCGLLFVAAYLQCNREIDCWLAFAVQEIIEQVREQFYPDGTSFEASTSYHRLSGEMVVFSSALILGLTRDKKDALKNYDMSFWKKMPFLKNIRDQEYILKDGVIFPGWYVDRIFKAGMFTVHLTKPTQEIPQIGDNDNGRFFWISSAGSFLKKGEVEKKYKSLTGYDSIYSEYKEFWDENILNHSAYISALAGIFDCEVFNRVADQFPVERYVIKSISKGVILKQQVAERKVFAYSRPQVSYKNVINDLKYFYKSTIRPENESDVSLKNNIKVYSYADFGIYIFISDRIHLTFSAGSNGQKGTGGHAHNDKLSLELNIDGDDIILDPGTYLYTPLPKIRNKFRSTESHNSLIVSGEEQNQWVNGFKGLFSMFDQTRCELLYLNERSIGVKLIFRDIVQVRMIYIYDDYIEINDYSSKEFKVDFNSTINSEGGTGSDLLYSNGYGKLINSRYNK
ncbi:MAG: hypothetical protein GY730_01270 [bacterium]|nr:hypothetical protein [bacterium]